MLTWQTLTSRQRITCLKRISAFRRTWRRALWNVGLCHLCAVSHSTDTGSKHSESSKKSIDGRIQSAVADVTEQVVFYRWPTMRHFRFISRFKVYQVSTMLFLLMPMGYWYHMGGISGQTLTYATISALGTTGVLAVLSYYFTRVAGEMAYIPSQSAVQISTLTFMGFRRDLLFPVKNVVPFADTQSGVGGAIQRLEIVGHCDVFLYSLRYGRVLDESLLTEVLGIRTRDNQCV